MTWHTVERAVFDNNGEWCSDMYGSGYFIRGDELYVNVLLGGGKSETVYVCTKSEFIQKRNMMLHEAFFGDRMHDAEVARKAFLAGIFSEILDPTTVWNREERANEYAERVKRGEK